MMMLMKQNAELIAKAAPAYLGVPYSKLDCQAFVEQCLDDIGISKNLAGSNTWYREIMNHGWTGTPEECWKKYGKIPRGAFLFILKQDGGEPEKYRDDGIGNASHIGIYTGETAAQMLEACGAYHMIEDPEERRKFVRQVSHGNGAIHSSSSRDCVCTSDFAGKTVKNGGWNRVGLWDQLDYETGGDGMEPYKAQVTGGGLNLRAKPDKKSDRICQIPNGSIVTVFDEDNGWSYVDYDGQSGYVMIAFLQPVSDGDTVTVPRVEIENVYAIIGKWLGR